MEVVGYYRGLAPYVRARFAPSQHGSAYVEYLLLIALIAVACMIAIAVFGDANSNKFLRMADSVAGA